MKRLVCSQLHRGEPAVGTDQMLGCSVKHGQDRLRGGVERVLPTPSVKAATERTAMVCPPLRPTCTEHCDHRSPGGDLRLTWSGARSSRSAECPCGGAKINQGNRPTKVTEAKAAGSRVMPRAINGSV